MQPSTSLKESAHYEAFNTPVTSVDVTKYIEKGAKNPGSGWIFLIVLFGALSAIFFMTFLVGFIKELAGGGVSSYDLDELSAPLYVSTTFGLLVLPFLFLNRKGSSKALAQDIQMERFAESNGWTYQPQAPVMTAAGSIFNQGIERSTYSLVRSADNPSFVFGTQRYAMGQGRGRSTYEWGFVAVDAGTTLPHIVLDAKGNNGKFFTKQLFSNLPVVYGEDKRVAVNPELDALYTVYSADTSVASKVAEVFTPQVVARLQALQPDYDIEILDGTVYAYRSTPFPKTRKMTTEVLELIDIITSAFNVSVAHTAPVAIESSSQQSAPAMKGHTPKYLRTLGIIGIVVQFIVLLGLIIF